MNTFDEVKSYFEKQMRKDLSGITPETRIKDEIGADSLDIMSILMDIEDSHGITIPDEALVSLITVGDVVNYLDSLSK